MSRRRRPGTGRTPFALRPALRLGRRLAFAKAGRAALIIALIGIPTAGFAAVAVVVQSTQPTTAESLDYDLGKAAAQMRVSGPDLPGMRQDPVQWQFTDAKRNSPVTKADEDAPFANVLAHVPDGALSIPVGGTPVVVQGPRGPVGLAAVEGSVWDPSLEGHWRVLDGSAPTARNQLMVTPATLDRLGAHIGDTVDLTDPVTKRFTITGTMRDLGSAPSEQGVFLPWGTTLSTTDTTDDVGLTDVTVYLPSDAPTWSEIRQLNAHGIVVQSRPVVLDPPDARLPGGQVNSSLGWYLGAMALLGVFAMFEVALLAGAAFLVGTRADTRSYAIVTSVGGDKRFVRTIVAGSGLVLGSIGAVLGVAVGTGIGVAVFRLIDNGDVVSFPGLHVPPLLLLVVAAAGVLAGLVSALVAARAATRINVLAALRGSLRPAPVDRPARRRRRIWGPVLIIAGAVMTLACGAGVLMLNDRRVQDDHWAWVAGAGVALGPCLMQLGIAICSPWLLALVSRMSARLGLSARLAARDARRNPVRTVPVLASVMSVVFVASVVITWSASSHAQYVRGYEYTTAVGVATSEVQLSSKDGAASGHDAALTAHAAKVVARVLDHDRIRVLGVAEGWAGDTPSSVTMPHRWTDFDCDGYDSTSCSYYLDTADATVPHIWTGTVDDYAVLTGHRPSAAVRDALEGGEAVSLWPEYAHDGAVRIDTFHDRTWESPTITTTTKPDASVSIPAVLDVQSPRIQVGVFMTKATAAHYGVHAVDGMLVTTLPGDIAPEQWDELSSAWQSFGGADRARWDGPQFAYEAGPVDNGALIRAIVLALAAAVTFGATAVAIGLARSDGRRDDEVLDAIGAAPRLRRRVSTWQAAILASVGAVIGTLLGLLPMRALTLRFTEPAVGSNHMPFVPDWSMLALLAIGLPLLVTAGAWLTAHGRRRVAVRRAH
ncbi:ABC-type lipoprotein release transport system permease subunit [Curtobacterium sp. PhB172]|uniref:ABC transporter permease n=1 Tax=Curtobacterium sp. PhB172 TaxID=2485196 RepID=UPI000F4BEB86|nr:FtsX-like permease family protein [Curtobacterium sp. PhB172]ROS68763.1 ABC-type lipoprotein release transport system permease subunit [Curtobacterium sp. PhB172]